MRFLRKINGITMSKQEKKYGSSGRTGDTDRNNHRRKIIELARISTKDV